MYVVTCDSCGDELASGAGKPTSHGLPQVFCDPCAGERDRVEAVLRDKYGRRAVELNQEMEAERAALLAAAKPAQQGGKGGTDWPLIPNAEV